MGGILLNYIDAPAFILIIISWLLCGFFANAACAEDAQPIYDVNFLRQGNDNAPLPDSFYKPDAVSAGEKEIEVSVNGESNKKVKIVYFQNLEKKETEPCFTAELLKNLGVNSQGLEAINSSSFQNAPKETCLDMNQKWPDATFKYDEGNQSGTLSVPQSVLIPVDPFAVIDQSLWDNGINAVRLNYNAYTYQTNNHSGAGDSTTNSSYLSLNSAINLGRFRFYSFDTFNKNDNEKWENNHDHAYGEVDVNPLLSTLSMGGVYSAAPNNIMGSIPINGMSIGTNAQMLPNESFNYTPVIRGVARTNAKVTIRQRNNIIYSKTVPPGSFAITDLVNAQHDTDLNVTVEESDGTQQTFSMPYTSVPDMIRPGSWRYSVSAGRYRGSDSLSHSPNIAQASLEYGFDKMTLSNVLLAGEGYKSVGIGGAYNLGYWGTLSLDWAMERHEDDGSEVENQAAQTTHQGQAVRVLYARQFDSTNTSFQVSGYHFRTPDFQEFSDYADRRWGDGDDYSEHRRNEFELTVNQILGSYGNVYLTLDKTQYYQDKPGGHSLTFGYNALIGKASVGLNASYNKTEGNSNSNDKQLSMNISIPLDFGEHHSSSLSFSTTSSGGQSSQNATLSDSVLDNTLDYSVSAQRNEQGELSPSAAVNYRTPSANYTASTSLGKDSDQYSLGVSGAMLGYSGGVILAQNLSDTVNIVEAPDAANVSIDGHPGVRTNAKGNAVVPYVTPYRENKISLDTRTAAQNVELQQTGMNVTPTRGAVTLTRFATRVGRRAIVKLTLPDGKNAPFGAYVYQEKVEVGMVANDGIIYLSGVLAKDTTPLTVQWGDKGSEQCHFTLPATTESSSSDWYQQTQQICQPGAA